MKSFRPTEEQLQQIQKRLAGHVRTHVMGGSQPNQPSKYRNKKTVVDGITFDSQREANRWQELTLMQKAGEITELERQVRYPIRVNGHEVCCYISDATYRKDGKLVVEDAKGHRTRDYILKRKLMKAALGIEVIEV